MFTTEMVLVFQAGTAKSFSLLDSAERKKYLGTLNRGGYRFFKLKILFVLERFLVLWHILRIFVKKKMVSCK